ncbi:MAG: hypothetical protein ACREIC_28670 [Limisphaerales bacterium]
MFRLAKSIVGLNFVGSMVLIGIYVMYALWAGLDLDSQFLGVPGHVRNNYYAWMLPGFLELQLVGMFIYQRLCDEPTTWRDGVAYVLWGALGLLTAISCGHATQASLAFDRAVGVYVWCSDILYGISLAWGD